MSQTRRCNPSLEHAKSLSHDHPEWPGYEYQTLEEEGLLHHVRERRFEVAL